MKLARILSIILGPQVFLPVLFLVFLQSRVLSIEHPKILLPTIILLQMIIPLGGPFVADKLNIISDWDLPVRRERYLFLGITLISYLCSLILIFFYGNELLFKTSAAIFILILALSAITLFWKISFHAAVSTMSLVLINYLFNWSYWYLFLLVIVVGWARIKLGKHTLAQVLMGSLVSFSIIFYAMMVL